MRKSTVAVMLSGLVFPGAGHLYLKQWGLGIVLMAVAASATYFIISVSLSIALDLSAKIQSGIIPADIDAITNLVSQQLSATTQSINLATTILLMCWLIGVVSVYWQGRALEKPDTVAQRP
ncbi:MAG: hypothetical protein OSA77_12605 [Halioglobus sp.]|nr:hypothetical protein [Halioglobus sp.]